MPSLKDLCRLQLLRVLGRDHYCNIKHLPIPVHLQQYVSHYRDWGQPPSPIKLLCPLVDIEVDGPREGEEEDESDALKRRRRCRQRRRMLSGSDSMSPVVSVQTDDNRQRVAVININGMILQVSTIYI